MLEPEESTFLHFFELTKDVPLIDLDFSKLIGTMPKTYPRNLGEVKLPPPARDLFGCPVAEVFEKRRSTRAFDERHIPLDVLSTLLHYAAGVKGYMDAYGYGRFPLRMFPSAGNLMPTEVYLIPVRVEQLEPHLICHYNAIRHSLEILSSDNDSGKVVIEDLVMALPPFVDCRPALAIILTTTFGKVEEKYDGRGARFVLLDAGVVIENFYLAATGLGLGVVALGAAHDDVMAEALGLDPQEDKEAPVIGLLGGFPGEGETMGPHQGSQE